MSKRRPCSCSSCLILREIRKLQTLMMEVLSERPDERTELPKGKDPIRGGRIATELEEIAQGKRCRDCGLYGERTGHAGCQFPGLNSPMDGEDQADRIV